MVIKMKNYVSARNMVTRRDPKTMIKYLYECELLTLAAKSDDVIYRSSVNDIVSL